jgi:hypothetical protein
LLPGRIRYFERSGSLIVSQSIMCRIPSQEELQVEENTMKYETPELTALTPAINASQAIKAETRCVCEGPLYLTEYGTSAYQDWE